MLVTLINDKCTGYQHVFLSLRGVTIPNNSYVDVADIGGKNSDKEGLLCRTDRFEHSRILQLSFADWHFPNRSRVWNYKDFYVTYGSVPRNTFQKNTAYGLIHLITSGSPPERGRFYCVIPDSKGTIQMLYVNVGMYVHDLLLYSRIIHNVTVMFLCYS